MEIDESRPAVNFKLVATPNEWRKRTVSSARGIGNVSERNERYREFFQELIDTLREVHGFTNARKGQPQSWYLFSSGHSRVKYSASFDSRRRAKVEVYIDSGDRDWNKGLFDQMYDRKEGIESQVGAPLEWERLDERIASRVYVARDGTIDDQEETLKEIRRWMIAQLLKFKEVFGPRLDELAI